ncbi:hypothetical protein FACS1894168_2360 [Deltaproteobacteria bacterium]|nr:hypothetical protein FACS1894168_2360 [Deltaproteobacteria bacterium]GHV52433.1 hypothetical protein FACS1894206_01230 [Deltaproteobacteria bacterium]
MSQLTTQNDFLPDEEGLIIEDAESDVIAFSLTDMPEKSTPPIAGFGSGGAAPDLEAILETEEQVRFSAAMEDNKVTLRAFNKR